MRTFLLSALAWLAIALLAILNGTLRISVLIPVCGVALAQLFSGVLLLVTIGVITWLLLGKLGKQPGRVFIGIGLLWLLATLLFEFGLGLRAGLTLHDLLGQYYRFENFNIWPLIVVWVAVAPWVLAHWRGLIARSA